MEYKIIMAKCGYHIELGTLEEQVNEAIKEGWRPQGGVALHFDENIMEAAYQAMVKE